MNLEQWQRSEKIKAEAEAAAKRTVERVLNAVKEPAMSEFEGKSGKWAWEIQKEQQAKVEELQTLYTQQGINMFKLQKRVDALEKAEFTLARIRSIVSKNLLESILIKEVRQALKGEG